MERQEKIMSDISSRRARILTQTNAKCDAQIQQPRATYPTAPRRCGKTAKIAVEYSYFCKCHAKRDVREYYDALIDGGEK